MQLKISIYTAHAGIIRNTSPKDVAEAFQIDNENDNHFQKDTIEQETLSIKSALHIVLDTMGTQ